MEITPDVKNIYCFDDAIGQDADYMFSFNCNSETATKIINYHSLMKDSVKEIIRKGYNTISFGGTRGKLMSWRAIHGIPLMMGRVFIKCSGMIMRNKKLTISNMICNKAYISTVRIEQTLMKEISLHAIIFLFCKC